MKQRLKIHLWDLFKARKREPLPVVKDITIEVPVDHDAAREVAQQKAREIAGGKVRSCSALAGPNGTCTGFAVIIELPAET